MQKNNERFKLKNSIDGVKATQKSAEIRNFMKRAQEYQDLKGILDEKGALLQFLESPAGMQIVRALITKFGGGSGDTAAVNIGEILQHLTPEQKAKGLNLIKEVMAGAD